MERRQAQIPLLLHPEPKDVLFLGLATGITAGGAADFPGIRTIDIVDLIPDVARAAKEIAAWNNNVLGDDRTSVYINDGRHYLLQTPKLYDTVISDLFVPWESMTGY